MTPQELKNSILQLAIQGKLVEQRPEEGTAEELYKSIVFNRNKANDNDIIDEVPFDIPPSWMWVKHNTLFEIVGGSQPPKAKFIDSPKEGFVRLYQIRDYGDKPVPVYVPIDSVSKFSHKGDILLARYGGSLGKIFWAEEGAYNVAMAKVVHLYFGNPIDDNYLYYYYCAPLYQTLVKGNTRSAQAGFNKEDLGNLLFPLPPLAEQKRIVAKIEELLPLIERYEKAWSRLEDFNKRFPVDMQKSILQMAIQGKLVEHRSEEGTGEELFRQIQAEKQALIKAGKIKKGKPLPEVMEDDAPFEIPETWKWCFVGDIFDHNTGKAMNSSAKTVNKTGSTRKFITTSNLYWNSFDFSAVKEMFFSDDELARCTATKNDILMCEGGAYYGRTAIWNYDYDICFQNHVHRLRAYKRISEKFFYHVFFFYRNTGMMQSKGTAMPGLSSVALHNLMIPLPPLAEQRRIVARLEELMPLCERLK